ncbi:MAG: cytochrome C oxidase subunit IV family protein [Saprospiraceae bacterium]|nr:cytochrome C oxidase subunit IV family protein [Saprospiraceae bacterium]
MVSYEEGLAVVKRGFWLLAAITVGEVLVALIGNGHIVPGFTLPKWIMYPAMISMSLYKAYWIVYNFMHMAYEVKGLAMSVLLPCLLLVWAVIAFFQEGGSWGARRSQILKKNEAPAKPASKQTGMLDIRDMQFNKVN